MSIAQGCARAQWNLRPGGPDSAGFTAEVSRWGAAFGRLFADLWLTIDFRRAMGIEYHFSVSEVPEHVFHLADLGLLVVDDLLRQLKGLGILSVIQLGLGHLDRALVMGDHQF